MRPAGDLFVDPGDIDRTRTDIAGMAWLCLQPCAVCHWLRPPFRLAGSRSGTERHCWDGWTLCTSSCIVRRETSTTFQTWWTTPDTILLALGESEFHDVDPSLVQICLCSVNVGQHILRCVFLWQFFWSCFSLHFGIMHTLFWHNRRYTFWQFLLLWYIFWRIFITFMSTIFCWCQTILCVQFPDRLTELVEAGDSVEKSYECGARFSRDECTNFLTSWVMRFLQAARGVVGFISVERHVSAEMSAQTLSSPEQCKCGRLTEEEWGILQGGSMTVERHIKQERVHELFERQVRMLAYAFDACSWEILFIVSLRPWSAYILCCKHVLILSMFAAVRSSLQSYTLSQQTFNISPCLLTQRILVRVSLHKLLLNGLALNCCSTYPSHTNFFNCLPLNGCCTYSPHTNFFNGLELNRRSTFSPHTNFFSTFFHEAVAAPVRTQTSSQRYFTQRLQHFSSRRLLQRSFY